VTGTYQRTTGGNEDAGPQTALELVRGSEVVLIGRVTANRGILSPSGNNIRTHYSVAVQRVLKGSEMIPAGNSVTITVSLLGGRVGFGPGTWAQLNVRNSDPPRNNRDYLFFMNRIPPDAIGHSGALDVVGADFWPTHGARGVFGLGTSGTDLEPVDRKQQRRPIVREARGNGLALIGQVEAAIARLR